MASSTMLKCPCGKVYHIYIPKRLQHREVFGTPEAAEYRKRIDRLEKEMGKIKWMKYIAERVLGGEWIDASINEVIECECGEVYNVLSLGFSSDERERLKSQEKTKIGDRELTLEEIELCNERAINEGRIERLGPGGELDKLEDEIDEQDNPNKKRN